MANAPPDAAIARFTDDIARLTSTQQAAQGRFAVAVSGGPDSMALLALALTALPGRVEAATFDHQLRSASGEEADMVAAWCAGVGIPHAILRPDTPITGNVQSAARTARYAALDRWRHERGIDWIMTAHHADDQAETLMMRLNRGSGVGGLAGVRARNGRVLRPVLHWRRAELADVVRTCALPYVTDPSNDDPRFDRVTMRRALGDAPWIDVPALSRSAHALQDAQEALEWAVAPLVDAHVRMGADGCVTLDRTDFPRELLRRIVLRMIALADPAAQNPRGDTIDQALVHLSAGRKCSIGALLLCGGPVWEIRAAPPRRAG